MIATSTAPPVWLTAEDCRLDRFRAAVERQTELGDYPFADAVERNVLIYGPDLQRTIEAPRRRQEVQAELARALLSGPGVVVFKAAFPDVSVVDRASAAFEAMITAQHAGGVQSGDHFAAPGANDRIWGALDKFAVADPAAFAAYYVNDTLALISQAWLGPHYQITSQVNVVNPGGQAQVAHRDYHLGFMSAEQAQRFPAHAHRLSAALTLQGAVAHCDMPVQTGPTMYLPYSQQFEAGYLAFHEPDFTAYFDENYVQLPLDKGDAVFFNPALFHGAATNHSRDVRRMANLLQVSSAFGRAMETVDRLAMSLALFPVLLALKAAGVADNLLRNVIGASAEGYAFPTNLDHDQPVDGLAPDSQAELVWRALQGRWSARDLAASLHGHAARRRSEITLDGKDS